MKYKAIVCDVDDTLVESKEDAVPSKRVVEAVKNVQEKGIIFSLATGRSLVFVEPLVKIFNLTSPIILEGGAIIYHPIKKDALWQSVINPITVRTIYQILSKNNYPFSINANCERHYNPKTIINKDVTRLATFDIPKKEALRFKKELEQIPKISVQVGSSWTGKENLDLHITNETATKQQALVQLAHILNISPKEIIGIGDHHNDLPLLMACGLKVAMGNAVSDLKAIADYVAPPLEEDGVADVIERFIPETF